MSWKRGAVWVTALVAGAFGASGAAALSLADLAGGGSFTAANGVSFAGFAVKVRGSLSRDLADYEVVPTEDGFYVTGGTATRGRARAARGRIQIRYDVGSGDPSGLLQGALAIQPGEERVSAQGKLFDGRKRIAKLAADSLGALYDSADLGGVAGLHVRERIRLDGGFVAGWVSSSFTAVPEPSTALLVGAGLAAAAASSRRRSA